MKLQEVMRSQCCSSCINAHFSPPTISSPRYDRIHTFFMTFITKLLKTLNQSSCKKPWGLGTKHLRTLLWHLYRLQRNLLGFPRVFTKKNSVVCKTKTHENFAMKSKLHSSSCMSARLSPPITSSPVFVRPCKAPYLPTYGSALTTGLTSIFHSSSTRVCNRRPVGHN